MSTPTNPTLPLRASGLADVSGLLRRCSPAVTVHGRRCIVVGPTVDLDGEIMVESDGTICHVASTALSLDLSSPTGRVHAAWWLLPRCEDEGASITRAYQAGECTHSDYAAGWTRTRAGVALCMEAMRGKPMTPTQVEHLRACCLRAAGREG